MLILSLRQEASENLPVTYNAFRIFPLSLRNNTGSSASCEIFTSLSKIVRLNISGQCEIFRNNSSGTTKNRKQEIGHPCRTPLNMGNLLEMLGYRITELIMPYKNQEILMMQLNLCRSNNQLSLITV